MRNKKHLVLSGDFIYVSVIHTHTKKYIYFELKKLFAKTSKKF